MEEELEHKLSREIAAIEDALHDTERQAERSPEVGRVDPFSLIGKVAVLIVVAVLLVGGGIWIGGTMNKTSNNSAPIPAQNNPNTTPIVNPGSENEKTSSLYPVEKTITAGGAKGTSFGEYTIGIHKGWIDKRETTDLTDRLTITKGEYEISIYQAPMGGNLCVQGDVTPAPMSQTYKHYSVFGNKYIFMQGWNDESGSTITSTLCQATDGGYASPTNFGTITIKTPNPSNKNISSYKEITSMLLSLDKK